MSLFITNHSKSVSIGKNATVLSNIYSNTIQNTNLLVNNFINHQTALVNSNLTVISNLTVDYLQASNIEVKSALFNNVTITNNLSILNKELVHENLEVYGNGYLNALQTTNLTFSGNLNISNLNINNSLYAPVETILGDLQVNKEVYISTALLDNGSNNLNTNITNLTLSNIVLDNNLTVGKNVYVTNDLTVLGDANIGKLKTTYLTFVDNIIITNLTVATDLLVLGNESILGNLYVTTFNANNVILSDLTTISMYNNNATITTNYTTLNIGYTNVSTLSNLYASYGSIDNLSILNNGYITKLNNQQNIIIYNTNSILNNLYNSGILSSNSILSTNLYINQSALFNNLSIINSILINTDETLLSNLYLYGTLLYTNQIINNAIISSLTDQSSITIISNLVNQNVIIGGNLWGSGNNQQRLQISQLTAIGNNLINLQTLSGNSIQTSNLQANNATIINSLLSVLGNVTILSAIQTNATNNSAIIPNIIVNSNLSLFNGNVTIFSNLFLPSNLSIVSEDQINGNITVLGTASIPNANITTITSITGNYTNLSILTNMTTLGNQINTNLFINQSIIGKLSTISNIDITSRLTLSNLIKYSDLIVGQNETVLSGLLSPTSSGETILGNLSILNSLTTSNLYNTNLTSFQIVATNMTISTGGSLNMSTGNAIISNLSMLAGVGNSSNLVNSFVTSLSNNSNNITLLNFNINNTVFVTNSFLANNVQFSNRLISTNLLITNLNNISLNPLTIINSTYLSPITITNLTATGSLLIQNATFTNITNLSGININGNITIVNNQQQTGNLQINNSLTLLSLTNIASINNLVTTNITNVSNLYNNQMSVLGSILVQNNETISNLSALNNNTILTATVTSITILGSGSGSNINPTNLIINSNFSMLSNVSVLGNLSVLQTIQGTNVSTNSQLVNILTTSNLSVINNTELLLIQGNESILGNIQIINPNPAVVGSPYINNWSTVISTNIQTSNLWIPSGVITTNITVIQNENISGNLTNATNIVYAGSVITTGNLNPLLYEIINTNIQVQNSILVTIGDTYLNGLFSTLLVNNIMTNQNASMNTITTNSLLVTNFTNLVGGLQYVAGSETVLQIFQPNTISAPNNYMTTLTVLTTMSVLGTANILSKLQVSNLQFINNNLTGLTLLALDNGGNLTTLVNNWSYLANSTNFYYSSLSGSSSVIISIQPTSLNIRVGLGGTTNQNLITATGLTANTSYLVSILTNLPESGVTAGLTGLTTLSLVPDVSLLTTNQALYTDGNMIVNGNISANNALMYRNKILNGAMNINQYNNSSILISSIGFSSGYTTFLVDRYIQNCQFFNGQIQLTYLTNLSIADAPYQYGFTNASMYSVLNALEFIGSNNYFSPLQIIEDAMITDLEWGTAFGKSITVSFWIKSNTLNHTIHIISPLYTNFYVSKINLPSAGTWYYITITVPPPPVGSTWVNATGTNGRGILLGIDVIDTRYSVTSVYNQWQTNGPSEDNPLMWQTTGNYLIFTGVQLEVGTVATPFEWKPYLIELNLCQRYFERIYPPTSGYLYSTGNIFTNTVLCNYLGVMTSKKTNIISPSVNVNQTLLNGLITGYTYFEPTINIGISYITANRDVNVGFLAGSYIDVSAELS